MKVVVERMAIDKKRGLVNAGTRVIETKAEGRHKMLCNLCGYSGYPECRSWCEKNNKND